MKRSPEAQHLRQRLRTDYSSRGSQKFTYESLEIASQSFSSAMENLSTTHIDKLSYTFCKLLWFCCKLDNFCLRTPCRSSTMFEEHTTRLQTGLPTKSWMRAKTTHDVKLETYQISLTVWQQETITFCTVVLMVGTEKCKTRHQQAFASSTRGYNHRWQSRSTLYKWEICCNRWILFNLSWKLHSWLPLKQESSGQNS